MENFTYSNSAVVSQMFQHLQNTSFPGLSVRLHIMKGTKVLTLGEGRGISYTHAIHVCACAVLLLVGRSINFYTTRGGLPSC